MGPEHRRKAYEHRNPLDLLRVREESSYELCNIYNNPEELELL